MNTFWPCCEEDEDEERGDFSKRGKNKIERRNICLFILKKNDLTNLATGFGFFFFELFKAKIIKSFFTFFFIFCFVHQTEIEKQ